jgi:ricin-type beta-trefoil lectin protein
MGILPRNTRKMSALVVATPIAIAASVVLGSATSASASVATGYTVKNVATGDCLDSNGSAYDNSCNSGGYQLWSVSDPGNGQTIVDRATYYCLDSNNLGNGTGQVYTLPCNGGSNQQWNVTMSGNIARFQDVATGLCLDNYPDSSAIGGAALYTHDCNSGTYQEWAITGPFAAN